MRCPYCGNENPDHSRFCTRCGVGLGAPGMQPREQQTGGRGGQVPHPGQNAGWNGGQTGGQNAGWNGSQTGSQAGGQNTGWSGGQTGGQNTGWSGGQTGGQNRGWKDSQTGRQDYRRSSGQPGRSREEKKIIVMGIILACIVLVAGVGAYLAMNHFMKSASQEDKGSAKAVTTLTPTPTPSPSSSAKTTLTPTPTATPSATPTQKAEKVTASLLADSASKPSGYSKVTVKDAMASSTLEQEEYDNSVQMVLDGNETTSWQEGVSGDGLGEFLWFSLGSKKKVRYLTFKLGNWRDQERYQKNNRPKQLTIWLGDESYTISFPDEKKEFCVVLSQDCEISSVQIYIDSVYKGTEWDDTCISEVGIYGK